MLLWGVDAIDAIRRALHWQIITAPARETSEDPAVESDGVDPIQIKASEDVPVAPSAPRRPITCWMIWQYFLVHGR